MTKTLLLSAALALSATAGTAAQAVPMEDVNVLGQRPQDDQLTTRVGYGDLDLATASGQRRLHWRVSGAVNEVCAPLSGMHFRITQQQCRSFAWNGARPQMALAVRRAQEIAARGSSNIAAVAITISKPR